MFTSQFARSSISLGLVAALASIARADEPPPPGAESGRTDATEDADSAIRRIGRGILVVPRVALEVAVAPVRAGLWANDRYHVIDRVRGLFFDDTNTYGLYPTARLDTGFGLTVGARFVHRDVLGRREHVALFAAYGGRYRQLASVALRSGERFGPLSIELRAEDDRRPSEPFHGIGNGDAAMETRYRQQLSRATAVIDARLAGELHAGVAGAVTELAFARSDEGPPIDEVYAVDSLRGFGGVRHAYSELELRWNGRRRASIWEPASVTARGWYAGVYAGRVTRLDHGDDFWRCGADVQHFLRLASGPRLLALRAHVEAVTGARETVPFAELPVLGGDRLLRGYGFERFRDRIAAAGSVEYQWDLAQMISASVFVDAGRVYSSAASVELDAMRIGYGVGVALHGARKYWGRATIATSIDGGVFVNLAFDPAFDVDERVERR